MFSTPVNGGYRKVKSTSGDCTKSDMVLICSLFFFQVKANNLLCGLWWLNIQSMGVLL